MFAQLNLEPTLASVPVARSLARAVLDVNGCAEVDEIVALLVTELVTNAVEHAGTAVVLSLHCDGSTVRVEVTDGARAVPEVREVALDEEGGRGVALVDTFADEWGVQRFPAGKAVWFEVPVPRAEGHDPGRTDAPDEGRI